ncbi:hypothetical protein NDU88_001796 [Pleurodeles waltl]|uniref:Uncharacterized protein n=1 Tax=Pleurodeles waltl TaxID=8319 RepID=A0AAV7TJ99_PLEWA|nr:hypothetical protein NDU88_001796 [Pleurodeles waltl]
MITFPTHKGGHILDPFFTNLEGLRVLGFSQLVWTDHMLVKMACSLSDSPFVSQDRFVLKRHWNKLSLEDFYHQLEKAPLGPLTEVDCGYDSFCEWISGALDSLIPMCWSKCHRKEPSPWYDTSLASLKRVCRQAERLWRKSYDSDLKICYLAKIKIYHRAVCQTRASFYAQQFQNSTNPSKLIFKVLKDLMAKRVIAGEICSDSHCEGLASFFHEKVQAIYRTFPTGSLMLEQVGRTLGEGECLSILPPLSLEMFDYLSAKIKSGSPADPLKPAQLKTLAPVCRSPVLGRGLAAIHDGRLRAELRMRRWRRRWRRSTGPPNAAGADIGVGDGERPTSVMRGERPPRRRRTERGEQA